MRASLAPRRHLAPLGGLALLDLKDPQPDPARDPVPCLLNGRALGHPQPGGDGATGTELLVYASPIS
ncbi:MULTISPECIES: hypothetical protein [Kribbella]|uniref:hypothetical protein n=1 Tax=Kribbella TaxID=182639 RepID=UPI0018EE80DA|nr:MULTISPECIES: hypothetical protein [Kribbella]